jgi:hypothetical protein
MRERTRRVTRLSTAMNKLLLPLLLPQWLWTRPLPS